MDVSARVMSTRDSYGEAPLYLLATGRLITPLTKREIEMAELVYAGLSNKEISQCTCISLDAVKFHLKNIHSKFGVKRRTQVVAVVVYLGIVKPRWLLGEARAIPAGEALNQSHRRIGSTV